MVQSMAERALSRKKSLGSYYTLPSAVRFLVDWGLAASPGRVMDPSSGDGRFLLEAARRGATGLVGCDVDAEALAKAEAALDAVPVDCRLHHQDFFLLDSDAFGQVDLVVGNPPFIRYQQFSGETRARALASALRVGARLSRLSASWAPFLPHALQFLRPRGAMAMVVPAELAQTAYGTETLRALCANFARIRLLTFRHNWFEDAQQETFLLLAEGRGGRCTSAELMPFGRVEDLAGLVPDDLEQEAFRIGADLDAGVGLAYLEPAARELFFTLSERPDCVALQSLGEVANGYVSGANDFFHCTAADGAARGMQADWLLPVARNSRSLRGLCFRTEDVEQAELRGTAHHLILPREPDLFSDRNQALDAFVRAGEDAGIRNRYKCRVRNPWWRVPGLVQADLFLPYMIGNEPHASVNRCRALYPNSLHGIHLFTPALSEQVALGLLSSLSLLSMELEGRSYGGGILKLEPTEMQRVRLIMPVAGEQGSRSAFEQADRLIRDREFHAANAVADDMILRQGIGLPDADVRRLRKARQMLLERRTTRGGLRGEQL